jgi:hypothetical protein
MPIAELLTENWLYRANLNSLTPRELRTTGKLGANGSRIGFQIASLLELAKVPEDSWR